MLKNMCIILDETSIHLYKIWFEQAYIIMKSELAKDETFTKLFHTTHLVTPIKTGKIWCHRLANNSLWIKFSPSPVLSS